MRSSDPATKAATCWEMQQRDADICLLIPVCRLDVAPDLRGRSLQRPDAAHSRWDHLATVSYKSPPPRQMTSFRLLNLYSICLLFQLTQDKCLGGGARGHSSVLISEPVPTCRAVCLNVSLSLCSCGLHVHHACGLREASGGCLNVGECQPTRRRALTTTLSPVFQAQIDQYVGLIRTQVNAVVGKWVPWLLRLLLNTPTNIFKPSLRVLLCSRVETAGSRVTVYSGLSHSATLARPEITSWAGQQICAADPTRFLDHLRQNIYRSLKPNNQIIGRVQMEKLKAEKWGLSAGI